MCRCKRVSSVNRKSHTHIRDFRTSWNGAVCAISRALRGYGHRGSDANRGDNKLHGPPRNGPNVKSGRRYDACDG